MNMMLLSIISKTHNRKAIDYQPINKTSQFFNISHHIQNNFKKRLEIEPKLRNYMTIQQSLFLPPACIANEKAKQKMHKGQKKSKKI